MVLPTRLDLDGNVLEKHIWLDKSNKSNPYQAKFEFNKIKVYCGCFRTPSLAKAALDKRRAECEADPTSALKSRKFGRELPNGVFKIKESKNDHYHAEFRFQKKKVYCGSFPTPELALAAMNKRRAECVADPLSAAKSMRIVRDLPKGVYQIKAETLPNPFVGKFSYLRKSVSVGCFQNADVAFAAVNVKRLELGMPAFPPLSEAPKGAPKRKRAQKGAAAAAAPAATTSANVSADASADVANGIDI